jgi:hypothetical protein
MKAIGLDFYVQIKVIGVQMKVIGVQMKVIGLDF